MSLWQKHSHACSKAQLHETYDNNLEKQPWWRHQMETFSALLAICAGNSPVTGELPAQRPVTRSFDIFFDLRLNKRLSKQWWGWWFEAPSRLIWRHCNDSQNIVNIFIDPVAFKVTANTQDIIGLPHSVRGDTLVHMYVRHTLSVRIIIYHVLIHTVAGKIWLSFDLHFYIFTCKSIWIQTSKQKCLTYSYGFSRNGVDFTNNKQKTKQNKTKNKHGAYIELRADAGNVYRAPPLTIFVHISETLMHMDFIKSTRVTS